MNPTSVSFRDRFWISITLGMVASVIIAAVIANVVPNGGTSAAWLFVISWAVSSFVFFKFLFRTSQAHAQSAYASNDENGRRGIVEIPPQAEAGLSALGPGFVGLVRIIMQAMTSGALALAVSFFITLMLRESHIVSPGATTPIYFLLWLAFAGVFFWLKWPRLARRSLADIEAGLDRVRGRFGW